MKTHIAVIMMLALITPHFMSAAQTRERRLEDISDIPPRVLQRTVSAKFYKTLLISPVKGWITVRGQLAGIKMVGARIIRSDLGGSFDQLALKLADELQIQGNFTTGSLTRTSSVLLHVVIYDIADGTLALSFANLDGPGEQMRYWGCSKLEVLHPDGTWEHIKGPEGLEGKGMMVRASDFSNNLQVTLKMEKIPGSR
ncbi:MAG: hypothetical protein M3Y80_11545 [Verrucomicrobiota bacterium]|nr:hypothetical protein [Verrucomicrobiota bacterium]